MLALLFFQSGLGINQFLIVDVEMRLQVDVVVPEIDQLTFHGFQFTGGLVVLADFLFQKLGAFGKVLLEFLFAVFDRFQVRVQAFCVFLKRFEFRCQVVQLAGEIGDLAIGIYQSGALLPILFVDLLVVVADRDNVVSRCFQCGACLGRTLAQRVHFSLCVFELRCQRFYLVLGIEQVGGNLRVFRFQSNFGFNVRTGTFQILRHHADAGLAFRSIGRHLVKGLGEPADAAFETVQLVHLFLHS